MKRLLIVNGHPDPRPERYCGALASAYAHGAKTAGWEIRRVDTGHIPLGDIEGLVQGEPPGGDISGILSDIEWANRIAIIYPLWFDRPPQPLRVLFGVLQGAERRAHTIITMDMPAFAYRSLLRPGAPKKALAIDIPGIVPDETVLIGCVSKITAAHRRDWIEVVRGYGKGWAGASVTPAWTFTGMLDRAVGHWWN